MDTDTPMKKRKIAGENPKLVFMFEFEKNNFSAIEKNVSSDKCKIGGLSWRLIIDRNVIEESNEEVLTVYLQCEGKSKLWCCYARIQLIIISQKDGVKNHTEKFESLYSSLKDNCGMDLMKWEEIVDPEKGYIKNDTVKIQAHIVADAPQNTDADYKKERPQAFDDWLVIFENEINDKLVSRIAEELKETNSLIKEELKSVAVSNETLKKSINAAIEPIYTKISLLERDFEKSCQDYFGKILEILEKSKENEEIGSECNENENFDKKRKNHDVELELMKKTKILCAGDTVRDICAEHQHRPFRSPYPLGSRAYYRYNELCSYNPLVEHDSQSCRFYHSCQHGSQHISPSDHPDCPTEKKCLQKGEIISSTPVTDTLQNETPMKEKCIAKEEITHIDSGTTPVSSNRLKLYKPSIPCQEEVDENDDLTKPMEKKLLLIGKDGDGDLSTHNITSLKELFELKKKYNSCEVLEMDNGN